jgi:hypothetical protein
MQVVTVILKFVVNDQMAGVHRKGADGGPPAIVKIPRLFGIVRPAFRGSQEFHGLGVAQKNPHFRVISHN